MRNDEEVSLEKAMRLTSIEIGGPLIVPFVRWVHRGGVAADTAKI